jgi:membrane protein implicated in regulation of membrane protease activity
MIGEALTQVAAGGFLLGLAVVASVASFFVTPIAPRMFAVLWLVFSVWSLVSALVLRRRELRAYEASAPPADCRDDLEGRPGAHGG